MATAEQTRQSAPAAKTDASDRSQHHGRLGPWQLLRLLGEGSLTRVYLARPAEGTSAGADSYAVKVLRKEWWHEPAAIALQRREAWVGSRVSHPNLLPVLSAGVHQAPFYLVTPRLPGCTLARLAVEGHRLSLPHTLWIVRQVAEGLEALGEATGMIHADIKPANIFVAPSGHATLLDFGFCRSVSESATWADRPVVGTLNYIAPEMITSALAADARSDIYSLGVTLYELLADQLPLESDDPAELARLHREAKPLDLAELRPDLPESVTTLVRQMLAKDPIRRPSTHSELIKQLTRLEIEAFALR